MTIRITDIRIRHFAIPLDPPFRASWDHQLRKRFSATVVEVHTDGALIKYNMVVLQDDKSFFPPYYAAPIVREDILKAYPQVASILDKLAGKFTDSIMQKLNYQVDVQHQSADVVAKQFLVSQGLLSS